MSIRMTNLVWNLDPDAVTTNERIILLCLADFANRHGREAWPAWSTVVNRTSLSRPTVWRCLNRLKTIGVLVPAGRSRRGTIVYRLNVNRLAELARTSIEEPLHSETPPVSQSNTAETPPVAHSNGGVAHSNPTSSTVKPPPFHGATRSGIDPVLNRKRTGIERAADAAKSVPPLSEKTKTKTEELAQDDPPPPLNADPTIIQAWIARHYEEDFEEDE